MYFNKGWLFFFERGYNVRSLKVLGLIWKMLSKKVIIKVIKFIIMIYLLINIIRRILMRIVPEWFEESICEFWYRV